MNNKNEPATREMVEQAVNRFNSIGSVEGRHISHEDKEKIVALCENHGLSLEQAVDKFFEINV